MNSKDQSLEHGFIIIIKRAIYKHIVLERYGTGRGHLFKKSYLPEIAFSTASWIRFLLIFVFDGEALTVLKLPLLLLFFIVSRGLLFFFLFFSLTVKVSPEASTLLFIIKRFAGEILYAYGRSKLEPV